MYLFIVFCAFLQVSCLFIFSFYVILCIICFLVQVQLFALSRKNEMRHTATNMSHMTSVNMRG